MSEVITSVNDGLSLIQNSNGLKYGTDALLLAAFIKREKNKRAVEIGSGTGIVSLLLAKRNKFHHIDAVEVQPYYADLTNRNVVLNGLTEKITAVCGDIRNYRKLTDTVFTNPPYMKTFEGKESEDSGKYIARHEVMGTIYEICESAGRLLQTGGRFYCVYRPDRLIDLLCAMKSAKLQPKKMCFIHRDITYPPSLVLISAKKDAGDGCDVLRPLFLTDGGEATEEANFIYSNGDWFE